MLSRIALVCLLVFSFCSSVFATGDANVTITSIATANGSWAYSAPNHTFTPSADNAVIIYTDVENRLKGSGFTAGNVIILTACSGTGTQSGDVSVVSSVTAAHTSSTQYTLTITAGGSITISAAINLTPSSNASGDGYPGYHIVMTAPSGITNNQGLTTTGGTSSASGGDGGAAGNITLTSSGGAVGTGGAGTISAKGGAGSTMADVGCNGGAGGTVTLSGTSISTANNLSVKGGDGTYGYGGAGGSFNFTSTSSSIASTLTITISGGAAGSTGGNYVGGAGGSITLNSATSVSYAAITGVGGAAYGDGTGGAGASVTITAGTTITNTGAITLTGGAASSSGSSGAGGNAGSIALTGAGDVGIHIISSLGGAGYGNGDGGNGGDVTLTSTSGAVTTISTITMTGGASGATGSSSAVNGGNGGSFTATAATNITLANATITNSGGAGSGFYAGGGNAGNFTLTATSGDINTGNAITCAGGVGGNSGVISYGGNGGTISMTASAGYVKIATSGTLDARGGTPRNGGTSNGADVTLSGANGVTLNAQVRTTGTSGTSGDFLLNDGNSSITSGAGNDGQATGYYYIGDQFTKTGTGNFNLLGTSNAWTGTTTLTAGTLTIGTPNVLPTTQVIMNGGTLATGSSTGNSETTGTLALTANSKIALGTGVHSLNFSASNGVTWTGGTLMNITGWTGNYDCSSGTAGKIYTGSSAELSAGKLAQIYFTHPTTGFTYTACQLSTGEIVPTSTLPVELISFTAEKNKNTVDVLWTTASEINSSYFHVLRSTDNNNFEIISKTNAAGNSNSMLHYSFVDLEPAKGINYYKLIEYDFDGTSQESAVVGVEFSSSTFELNAYPNPTINSCSFDFYSQNGGIYYLKAYNSAAQEIYSAMVAGIPGTNKFCLNMNDFATGTYYFQLFDLSNKIASVKVVKE